MLQPPDMGDSREERGIGDLVGQLVDEGKAYARAELHLAKAIAKAKASGLRVPAILLGGAFLFAQAAVTVFAVALFATLDDSVGPLLAGLLAFLLFAAVAGGLGWIAVRRLGEDQ